MQKQDWSFFYSLMGCILFQLAEDFLEHLPKFTTFVHFCSHKIDGVELFFRVGMVEIAVCSTEWTFLHIHFYHSLG